MENKDQRLTPAYQAIDEGRIDVLSLDLFDTLIWRQVPKPNDLFLILGHHLKENGWVIPAVTPTNFAKLRADAERHARGERLIPYDQVEVTLSEIYWKLLTIFTKLTTEQMLAGVENGVYETDVSHLVAMEVALEKRLIHFDQNCVNLILYAHEKQIPVIIVSDTYFESEHIQSFFEKKKGLFPLITHFYLSCEYGHGKRGDLFPIIIKDHGTRILHIGDNKKSDCIAAKENGIDSLYFEKYDQQLREILHREWTHVTSKRASFLDPKEGDFGLTALRAKCKHHIDLKAIDSKERFFWMYGAQVLGPILFGFINWIYERCHEMNQKEVFCLMREGTLYADLIKRFAPYYPKHQIEAHELWVSREFVTQAALARFSSSEINAIINGLSTKHSLQNCCERLGLDINDLVEWRELRHTQLSNKSIKAKFTKYLCNQNILAEQVLKNAADKRKCFLKYFSTLADLSAMSQMTLVDVGWAGTTQGMLRTLLNQEGHSTSLHGLYLGTTHRAHQALSEGDIREGYLFRGEEISHTHGCFILEQTATTMTGVGSLKDIDAGSSIVTAPSYLAEKQIEQAEAVRKGIFAFFEFAGSSISLDAQSEPLRCQLRAIFNRSMLNTTQTEAYRFGDWQFEYGPSSNLVQVVGEHGYYDRFIKDMLPNAAFNENHLTWPAAYAAKYSKYLTLQSQTVKQKTVPSRCFLSEDAFSLNVYVDIGLGFGNKPYKRIDLRSNPNRSFYSLFDLISLKKPIKRARLVLSFPSAIVRIKSLRVLLFDRKCPDPVESVYFESKAHPSTIECVANRQLDFNTFHCDEHLELLLPFEQAHLYQIKCKLCCETFKLESGNIDKYG